MVKHMSSNGSPQDTTNRGGGRVRRYYPNNSVVSAAGQAINNSSSNVVSNNKISSHFQYVSSASPAGSAAIMSSDQSSPQAIPSSSSSFVRISNVHLIDHGYGTPIAQPTNNQQQQHLVTQSKQESQITNYYKVSWFFIFLYHFILFLGISVRTLIILLLFFIEKTGIDFAIVLVLRESITLLKR